MTNTLAPRVWRYFGTKRIHSSSPVPMTKIATRMMTRLRVRAKKSVNCFPRLISGGFGASIGVRRVENERELEISLTYRPKPSKYKRFTAEERPEALIKTLELWSFVEGCTYLLPPSRG